MPSSEARIAANRANALKSTGPRTAEGKAVSRRNSLKHGLTGDGIVLPDEDEAAVSSRFEEFEAHLKPANPVSRVLVQRAALLSVRMERCVRQESAATTQRMLRADEEFTLQRLAVVDHAHSWIANEPATFARRLRSMPEGVDRVVESLVGIRDELGLPNGGNWGWPYADQLANLLGLRRIEAPFSKLYALTEAVAGNFELLLGEAGDLDDRARRSWARARLAELIDVEIDKLRAHRETLDPARIEAEREGAAARAIFDPSKEAILARKYEAAAERGFYKALKELRQAEARPAAGPEVPSGAVGSSCPDGAGAEESEAEGPAPAHREGASGPPAGFAVHSTGIMGPVHAPPGAAQGRPGGP